MKKDFIAGNIFQVIYKVSDIDRIFISKELAKERIFSLVDFNHPKNLQEIKQVLQEFYDITDKNSMYQAIMHYDGSEFEGVLTHLLYQAYKEFGAELTDMTWAEFTPRYLSESSLKEALKIYLINFSDEDFKAYKERFESFSKGFFGLGESERNLVPKFVNFCNQTSELFTLCERTSISAFDYARVLQILSYSYAANYIDEKEYFEQYNFYMNLITQIFSGFGEFMASFLLGSAFMNLSYSDDKTDFIKDINERIKALYVALNSPYDMFKESGIWTDSLEAERAKLNEILSKHIDKNENQKKLDEMNSLLDNLKQDIKKHGFSFEIFTQTLDLFYENFYNILKEYRVETLVSIPDKNLIFTPRDELELNFYASADTFIKKAKILLQSDEFPIMVNLSGKSWLITNKAVYILSGMLMFKKLKRVALNEADFKIKTHYTREIRCFVNQNDYFEICTNEYEKLTGKKLGVENDKNDFIFKDEIEALWLAFNKLKSIAKS